MNRAITIGFGPVAVVFCCAALVAAAGGRPVPQASAEAIAARLSCHEQPLTDRALSAAVVEDLRVLYGTALELQWTTAEGRPTADGVAAAQVIGRAGDDGLDPEMYGATPIQFAAGWLASGQPNRSGAIDFDVALSAGLLSYLRDLHGGRVDPRRLGYAIAPRPFDAVSLVRAAIARHDVDHLSELAAPDLAVYRSLRSALARYRMLAADRSLSALPEMVPIRAPMSQADALTIGRLLLALGDAGPGASATGPTDPLLTAAARHFQIRHGLSADGVIGSATLAALRTPIAVRVRQIELALERLRWLPPVGRGRFIAINIPMFRLWAWNQDHADGVPAFGMNVIVGRAVLTRTPVLLDAVRAVAVRPFWNVPVSIIRHEILPALAVHPDYLETQHMQIVTSTGAEAGVSPEDARTQADLAAGRLGIRQLPGPANSLGLIKFVLSNDEDVYLHDTPARDLFDQARRDFSHGCIRVQDPVRLASWLLASAEWSEDQIRSAAAGDETRLIPLDAPVPLILFYLTAVVMPDDGTIHFAADIYGDDARLDRALARLDVSVR